MSKRGYVCAAYTTEKVIGSMAPDVIIIYRGLLSPDITSAYINLPMYGHSPSQALAIHTLASCYVVEAHYYVWTLHVVIPV